MRTSTVASLHKAQPTSINETLDSDLPEGWAIARVTDLFNYWGGATPSTSEPTYWGGGVPWISSKDVKEWRISRGTEYVTDKALRETRLSRCPAGSVLVVVRSGILAHTLPVAIADAEVVINQDLKAFYCSEQLVNEWFALTLRAKALEILATNRKDGTTVQSIRFEQLKELEFPIPPLAEQKRIIVKVEALLARVNAVRERLAKVPRILKRFRQAALAAACSGRLTADWRNTVAENGDLPPGWQWRPVGELLPKGGIFDGPFGSNLKTSDYTDSGVRVIRMENVAQLKFIELKEAFISEEKYQSLIKHTVGQGDIIFASFIEDEVRVCVLPALSAKAIAKADCFCLRPTSDVVDRYYLALQLASRDSYDALRESIHGATRPRITTAQLRQLPVRVCPLPEQYEIVRRVEALFKLADTIEKRVATATARAEKLPQVILAKAFHGEFVPTEAELARREGRSYEPASVLLARIKAERESLQRM